MSFTEQSSHVLDARFLVLDNVDPLAGFPLLAPDGTLAAASYAFEQNAGTGMTLQSDNVTFGVNGVTSVGISMEGNVAIAGGVPTNYGATTPGEGVVFINSATSMASSVTGGGVLCVCDSILTFLDTNDASIPISTRTGDVTGPVSSTQNAIASFDGVSGKIIQNTFLIASSTSTLLAPDGSGSDNVYSFTSDADTGMYYDTGVLELSAGGNAQLRVGASSLTLRAASESLGVDGSAGTPAYSFTSASTSGMYVSGTDIHLVSNGASVLIVDDTGAAVPNTVLANAVPSDYGAGTPGVGVVFTPEAITVPSGTPNNGSGSVLYVSGNSIFSLNASGVSMDITQCIEETTGTTTLNAIARFDGVTGKIVQNSIVTIDSAGQWAADAGTVGNASYRSPLDIDTGIYSSGAGLVSVTSNSALILDASSTVVTATPVFLVPDGSVSAPTHSFINSTTSGMYLDGASGCLAVASSGAAGIFMHDNHNVGVCGAPLNSFGSGTGVVWVREVGTAPSTNPSSGVLVYTQGAELLARNSAGDVITLTDEVTGPGSATDEAFAIYSGAGGDTIQNSLVTGTDAGQTRAGDGSSSNAAYSFTSDPDSGLYISGTDVFVCAGAGDQLMVNGSVVQTAVPFEFPSGTVGAPSLIFTSDPNTGIFRPTTDQLAVSVGASSGCVVALGVTDGNVGLTGGTSFGGGDGVVYLEEVSVVPVGLLTSGGVVYVNGDNFVFHDDGGTATTLNPTSPVNHVEGPATSAVNEVVYWADTSGGVVDSATSVTSTSTQLSATEFRQSSTVGISNDTNRLAFEFEAGNSMFVGTGGVEVEGVPLHADADVRIGGASGALESFSGSTHTTNHLNAAGTYEWQQAGTTIFTTDASRNLSTANSIVFPSGTEQLGVGNTAATKYTLASTSSGTPDHITFGVNGVTRMNTTLSNPTISTAAIEFDDVRLLSSGNFEAADGSAAEPAYELNDVPGSGMYYDPATSSVCLSAGGTLSCAIGLGATSTNLAFCVTSPPASYNGGDGVVYIGEAAATPGTPTSGVTCHVYADVSDDNFRYQPVGSGSGSTLNAVARRANITLSAFSVADATSDDLDGETWTDVDSAGVSGTTTGALSVPVTIDACTVMVIAEASWASNSTGYRRLSITTSGSHTVEATVTNAAVNGDVTVQTATLVRRLATTDTNMQFAAQVFQNSTGALNVDVTMSLIRLN